MAMVTAMAMAMVTVMATDAAMVMATVVMVSTENTVNTAGSIHIREEERNRMSNKGIVKQR